MTSERRTNPAPAVYAVTVAVVAFIISVFVMSSSFVDGAEFAFPVVVALIMIAGVFATVAVVMASDGFGPIVFFTTVGGTVMALNVALFLSVALTINNSGLPIPAIVLPVFTAVAIVIAALFSVGSVAAGHRWFPSRNPVTIVIVAVGVNFFIVAVASAIFASEPDGGNLFFGVGGDIWFGTGLASLFTGEIWFVVTVVFVVAAALRNRCRNAGIDRIISTIAVGGAVIIAIVTIIFAAFIIIISIANTDKSFDVVSAIVAGVVSLLSGIAAAGIAAIIRGGLSRLLPLRPAERLMR